MTSEEKIRMQCPECRVVVRGRESVLENKVDCPKCKSHVRFILPLGKARKSSGDTGDYAPIDPEDFIRQQCPNCQVVLKIKASLKESEIDCPKCKTVIGFTYPVDSAIKSRGDTREYTPVVVRKRTSVRRRDSGRRSGRSQTSQRYRRDRKRHSLGNSNGLTIVGVLIAVVVVGFLMSSRRATPPKDQSPQESRRLSNTTPKSYYGNAGGRQGVSATSRSPSLKNGSGQSKATTTGDAKNDQGSPKPMSGMPEKPNPLSPHGETRNDGSIPTGDWGVVSNAPEDSPNPALPNQKPRQPAGKITPFDDVQNRDLLRGETLVRAIKRHVEESDKNEVLLNSARKKHADSIKSIKNKFLKAYDAALKRASQKGDLKRLLTLQEEKKTLETDGGTKGQHQTSKAGKKGGDKTLERARAWYLKEKNADDATLEKAQNRYSKTTSALKKELVQAYERAIKHNTKNGNIEIAKMLLREKVVFTGNNDDALIDEDGVENGAQDVLILSKLKWARMASPIPNVCYQFTNISAGHDETEFIEFFKKGDFNASLNRRILAKTSSNQDGAYDARAAHRNFSYHLFFFRSRKNQTVSFELKHAPNGRVKMWVDYKVVANGAYHIRPYKGSLSLAEGNHVVIVKYVNTWAERWMRLKVNGKLDIGAIRTTKSKPKANPKGNDKNEVAENPLTVMVKKSRPKGAKRTMTIYANCDDSFTLYQNKTLTLLGAGPKVSVKGIRVRVGDVLMVRAINNGGGNGFACVLKGEKRYFRTDIEHWKSYIPKNKEKWFLKSGITEVGSVILGNNQVWKNGILAKSDLQCDSIWGGSGSVSYLVLVVTKDIFRKLKK